MEKDVMYLARMIGMYDGEMHKVLIVFNKQTFHYNMMKPVIIIAIAFVLLIPVGSSNLIQQSYADLDVETIELELVGWKKI